MIDNREQELPEILQNLKDNGMYGQDISDNEMAKCHARYLVGGRSKVENERLYRFGMSFEHSRNSINVI
jgi:threonine dehydratase